MSEKKEVRQKRLKKYRQEHSTHLSIYALAEVIGAHPTTVSRWENGKGYPPHDMIIALEDFFGKPYRDLFTDLTTVEESQLLYMISQNTKKRP